MYLKPLNIKNGIKANCDKDDVSILNSHFHALFNSKVEVYPTVLEGFTQYEIDHDLGETPTRAEITSVIKACPVTKPLVNQN